MLQQNDRWLWPFELIEKIGEGGMGVVYRGRYVVNDRPVAVKLLPADVTDETQLGRFEREVEILKTLRHPNIVHCFGGSCENKRRFYAMELVEGGTLDDLLRRRGRLPWELVVEYAKQICSALAYAHERNIVHRDLKPGNFLIGTDGRIKLSDFGLATLLAGRRVTAAGRTAGTYEYMAPEQITGKELSPRTDLYALGCVLFELLTGKPPFVGSNSAEVLHSHLKKTPPRVVETVPECPAALDELVTQLLEKAPGHRPQSAAEVGQRLSQMNPMVQVVKARSSTGVGNQPTAATRKKASTADAETVAASRAPVRPPENWIWLAPIAVAIAGIMMALVLSSSDSQAVADRSISEWKTLLENGDFQGRVHAIQALGRLANDSDQARELLLKTLQDSEPGIRREAVIALRSCPAVARPHIPEVQRMLNQDDQASVRAEVPKTLEVIAEAGAPRRGAWWRVMEITLLAEAVVAVWLWRRRPRTPA